LPVSSHIFTEASAHVMALTPDGHLVEWLDLAGSVLAEPLRRRAIRPEAAYCAAAAGLPVPNTMTFAPIGVRL
jgi:hypothetical protein